jgi:predicted dehydrogenase
MRPCSAGLWYAIILSVRLEAAVAETVLGAGIVGCGVIAGAYLDDLVRYPEVDLRGVADLQEGRARELAARKGVRAYSSPHELLADPTVDIVVNLTTHQAHREVSGRALAAGKHVHSEKPLALTVADAQALVELADRCGKRLSCAPATFLGEAQQTAMKVIRDGRLGPVRVVYAEVNWGRIESWHPAPQSFYEVGPLFDVGVYPLALATAAFGPASRVTAYGKVVKPQRHTLDGQPFSAIAADFITTLVEFNDVVLRLTASFYVGGGSRQRGFELHGDEGSLILDDWQRFDSPISHRPVGGDPTPVPPLRAPYPGIEWGRPVRDLVAAIAEQRPHRASGEQAAHIVEILDATRRSYEGGCPVPVHSTFAPPAPMEWAR